MPSTQAPRRERLKECAGTRPDCLGVVTAGRGLFCAVCLRAEQSNGFAPAQKITLPKTSKRETYAAGCCRLAHQGLLNGARVRPVLGETYEHELCWCVTSQSTAGGYQVVHNTAGQWWACSCEAHEGGKLCAHVALCRTWLTECPTCSAPLVAYADRVPGETRCTGAVRCMGTCGLVTDLTEDEAEALQEAHLGVHTLPVLGLLLVVVRRVTRAAESMVA